MRASLVVLFFAVAVSSVARAHTIRTTYTANLNDYVDSIITNLQEFLLDNELDSIALPNNTQSFSTTPVWITYSGRLSLYDGILKNLYTVRRYGDIVLSYGDKVLAISANLGIDTMTFNYNYNAKLIGFLTASGRVEGRANTIDTSGVLSANFNTYTLSIDSFSVNSLGTLSVRLRGNALVDWFANAIIRIIVASARTDIISTIETEVTGTVEGYLEQLNAIIAPSSLSSTTLCSTC